MKPKIIDISIPLQEGMPIWPDSSGIHLKQISSLEKGNLSNETRLDVNLHTGTHLDSPRHFVLGGEPIDKILLEKLIGPTFVADLSAVKAITARDLENLNLPKDIVRLLLRTSNSNFWEKGEKRFQKDFIGLTSEAASWVVGHGIQLIGIDYLSVAQFDKTIEVHQILLKNGIVILEGLNLSGVKPGPYQLICLPIKLINTEAAPARAILIKKYD